MEINFITKLTEDDFKDTDNYNSFKDKYSLILDFLTTEYERDKDEKNRYNKNYMAFHKRTLMDTNIDVSEECVKYHYANSLLHDLAEITQNPDYFDNLICGEDNIRLFDENTLLIKTHGCRSYILMDNTPIYFKLNSLVCKYMDDKDYYMMILLRKENNTDEFNIYELVADNIGNKMAIAFSPKHDMIVSVPEMNENKKILNLQFGSLMGSIIKDRIVDAYLHPKESLCMNITYMIYRYEPNFIVMEGLWKILERNKYKNIDTESLIHSYMVHSIKLDLFTMYNLLRALSFIFDYTVVAKSGVMSVYCCFCNVLGNNIDFSDGNFHCQSCNRIYSKIYGKLHHLLNSTHKYRYKDDFTANDEFPDN